MFPRAAGKSLWTIWLCDGGTLDLLALYGRLQLQGLADMALALLCSVFVSFTPNQVSWCQIVHLSALKLISFADILLDDILKTYWSSQVCVCVFSFLAFWFISSFLGSCRVWLSHSTRPSVSYDRLTFCFCYTFCFGGNCWLTSGCEKPFTQWGLLEFSQFLIVLKKAAVTNDFLCVLCEYKSSSSGINASKCSGQPAWHFMLCFLRNCCTLPEWLYCSIFPLAMHE